MDANEARKLSEENGYKEKFEKEKGYIERSIKDACENGRNSICFGSLDEYKNPIEIDLKKHFAKLGYKFKPTGYCGGVWQHTEDMYW